MTHDDWLRLATAVNVAAMWLSIVSAARAGRAARRAELAAAARRAGRE